jgi:hypothetical protein
MSSPRGPASDRRAALRRRARQIRRAVAAGTVALFLVLFAVMYVQLASGENRSPASAERGRSAAASSAESSSTREGSSEGSEAASGEASRETEASESGSSETGSSESRSSESGSGEALGSVRTAQS